MVGPGDLLAIEVWKEDELTNDKVVVTPDGYIDFPLTGSIEVMDRTLSEVADRLVDRLREFIQDPIVTVELKESRSAQVQVYGEVKTQGPVPYRDRLSLVQAIGDAGGPEYRTAKFEAVHIVRGALDEPQLIALDLEYILEGVEKDVFLEPGDIVVVPPKYVTQFDRYVQQLLAPLAVASGTVGAAGGAAITGQ